VGPGKAGGSVARWLLARGARLTLVARRRAGPLPRWVAATGARPVPLEALASDGDDLLLVAVPDGALQMVATTLARRPQAAVALHLSGAQPGAALAVLRRGAGRAATSVGGFHPLRAFPRPLPSPAVARRTFFALDGDPAAVALGRRLAAALGAPCAEVATPLRPLYHLAATWAAGGTVTLLGAAVALHAAVGVDPAAAAGLRELAAGALAAVDPRRPAAALTGPVARGDGGLLAQLTRLRAVAPELHPLAVLIALEGLRQLAVQGVAEGVVEGRGEGSGDPSREALRRTLREVCADPGFLDPLLRGV
jgi:predicted short-subunit dehydrogenase-like oxidoreductase (DUF2520 family)